MSDWGMLGRRRWCSFGVGAAAGVGIAIGIAVCDDASTTRVVIVVGDASGLAIFGCCTPTIPLKLQKVEIHLIPLPRKDVLSELNVARDDEGFV